jgi:hypothetical protein
VGAGMSPDQILVAHIVRALAIIAVVGLVARRRAHLCWSFLAYLLVVLAYNSLVTFQPEQFYKAWFWILGHGLFDALRMAIAFELAFRTFQAFPAANATARRLLFGLLAATSIALVGIPVGTSSTTVLLEWQPRVLTGTIWLMNGLAILITWYRVPVHAYHKALLLAFVPYLLVFTTLLSLIKQWGWGFFPYAQALEPVAFMVLMGFWAWSSWRDEPRPQASPALVHLLQPWRA